MAGNSAAVKVKIDHVVKKFNVRNSEVIALNAKHTPPPGTEVFTKKNLNFRLNKGA